MYQKRDPIWHKDFRQFTNEDVVFMLELGVRFFFYPGSPLILNYRVNEIVMLKGSVPYKSLF